MAETLAIETDRVASLPELVEEASRAIDPREPQSLRALAPALRALANDRGFLAQEIARRLADWRRAALQGGPVFVLARGEGFLVRAIAWAPQGESEGVREWEEHARLFRTAHDHPFSFLTVGYVGPGYETALYERAPGEALGAPGEPVTLRFVERTRLTRGKLMFYRAGSDIHFQDYPEAFSISLSVVAAPPDARFVEPCTFDVGAGTFTGHAERAGGNRALLCQMAKYLGDARLVAPLERLAATYPMPRVRAAAYESVAALEPDLAPEVWRRALGDAHPHVRLRAETELGRLED